MYGLAFSMGVSNLVNYLTAEGKNSKIKACFGVSGIFNPTITCRHIGTAVFGIQDYLFGTGLAIKLRLLAKDYNSIVKDPKMKISEKMFFVDFTHTLIWRMTNFDGYKDI